MQKSNFIFWLLFVLVILFLGLGFIIHQRNISGAQLGAHYLSSLLKSDKNSQPLDIFDGQISAEVALVGNINTGEILYSRNANVHTLPASIGKLIAAMVIIDNLNMNDTITITQDMLNPNWGTLHFSLNEKFKVKDLLNMGLVMSCNDAIMALAYSIGEDTFVGLMNQKIKEIGLEDTGFFNPLFFDSEGNFTTALDLFQVSRYIYNKYPQIGNITRMKAYTFKSESGITHLVLPTNILLDKIPEIWGAKTGVTPEAKECLLVIYEFQQNNQKVPYVTIVLKSDNRFKDTEILYQWLKNKINTF